MKWAVKIHNFPSDGFSQWAYSQVFNYCATTDINKAFQDCEACNKSKGKEEYYYTVEEFKEDIKKE